MKRTHTKFQRSFEFTWYTNKYRCAPKNAYMRWNGSLLA